MTTNKLKGILLFVVSLSYLLILIRTTQIPMTDLQGRHFIRGDGYSDQNVYSTVLWVRDFGFLKSYLRPVFNYHGDGKTEGSFFYTHYPALPDMLTASWSRLINSVSEPALRVLPIMFSFLLIYLVWAMFGIFELPTNDKLLNLIILVPSGYFILWADSLHKHLYENLVNFAFAILLWNYYREGKKSRYFIYFLPLVFFATQVSYETYVSVAIMVVGCSFLFEKGFKKLLAPINLYLGFLFVAGLLLHFYLNSLALGSIQAAIQDVTSAYSLRTSGQGSTDVQMTLAKKLELVWLFVARQERYFFIPGLALGLFFYWFYKEYLVDPKRKGFLLVLLIASFAWYLAMPQHAYVHHFTAKHSGLWVCLIGAFGLRTLKNKIYSSNDYLQKGFYWFTAFYIFVMGLTQIVGSVWWTYSLSYLFR